MTENKKELEGMDFIKSLAEKYGTKKRMLAIKTPKFYVENRKNLIVIKEYETEEVMFIWGKISKTFCFVSEYWYKAESYFKDEFLGITNYHTI